MLTWRVFVQISKSLFDLLRALKDSVISLDSEMNVTSINDSQANLFGSTDPAQAIGKNFYEIDPLIAEKIFKEEILEAIAKKEIKSVEWQSVYTADLWRTTIFPAADGIVITSRVIAISENKI